MKALEKQWIDVNDEEPPSATYVKVLYEDGTTDVDMKQPGDSYCYNWSKLIYNRTDKKVTHWQY